MNNKVIDNAIENGIRLSEFPLQDVKDKLTQIIDAMKYMGLDFSQIKEEMALSKISSVLKVKYGYLTDHELTLIIDSGCQGEFKKTYQSVKGYNFFNWINEYTEVRRKMLQDKRDLIDEDKDHKRYDVSNSPVGSAIIWKMNRVQIKDWETIPLKEIAEAVKKNKNMNEFANRYGIELINRK